MSLPILLSALIAASSCDQVTDRFSGPKTAFDAQAAMGYVKTQLDFGPRVPGTPAHVKAGDWLVEEMKKRADTVIVQSWTQTTKGGAKLPLRNVFARINPSATQRVLFLTHWDTRPTADEDTNLGAKSQAIPGANDGASGVALLMAIADALKKTPPTMGVDLLFVDGEDWGAFEADGAGAYPDALFGSQYFANNLPSPDYKPMFGVLFDMIGDADLQIYREGYSAQNAPEVVTRVWETADQLGYGRYFINENGDAITDDHLPLQKKGLRVIDVIDIQYGPLSSKGPTARAYPNYHHTMQDTFDKVSPKSLQIVGDVALTLVK
jgi:Zn-dependent M28 family amino/carboxypeptidase